MIRHCEHPKRIAFWMRSNLTSGRIERPLRLKVRSAQFCIQIQARMH